MDNRILRPQKKMPSHNHLMPFLPLEKTNEEPRMNWTFNQNIVMIVIRLENT